MYEMLTEREKRLTQFVNRRSVSLDDRALACDEDIHPSPLREPPSPLSDEYPSLPPSPFLSEEEHIDLYDEFEAQEHNAPT